MKNPYLTIAGQTAPGDGILLKGVDLAISADHVIIRHMRIRLGDIFQGSPDSTGALAVIGKSNNVIFDHVSISWGSDDTLGFWEEPTNITVQWSIISEGVACGRKASCHSKGMLQGNSPLNTVSIHHNLIANSADRNPYLQTGLVDLINNVNHNTGGNPTHLHPYWASLKANLVGNYFSKGPNSTAYAPIRLIGQLQSPNLAGSLAYISGNIHPVYRPNNSLPDLKVVMFTDGPPNFPTTTTRIPTMSYPSETDAFKAYEEVLIEAGDSSQLNADGTFSDRRSVIDARIVNEVRTGTGQLIISTVNEVGGFPALRENVTPYTDSDHDGMSDVWEIKYGFNKNSAADGNGDRDGDGYTNLEEFLNGTPP